MTQLKCIGIQQDDLNDKCFHEKTFQRQENAFYILCK